MKKKKKILQPLLFFITFCTVYLLTTIFLFKQEISVKMVLQCLITGLILALLINPINKKLKSKK